MQSSAASPWIKECLFIRTILRMSRGIRLLESQVALEIESPGAGRMPKRLLHPIRNPAFGLGI
jgi:hypothetical protein